MVRAALVFAVMIFAAPPVQAETTLADGRDLRDLSLQELMELDVESVSSFEPAPIDRALADVVAFNRADLEAMAALTLLDILRFVPGLDVAVENDGRARPAIRGLDEPPGILLVIDGVRINDPMSGAAPFDLPAALIERVEIIRGPGSAVYGSNAILGVVRVTTRTPKRLSIGLLVGSYRTAQIAVVGDQDDGTWDVRSSFAYERAGAPSFTLARDALTPTQADVSEAPGALGGAYGRVAADLAITRGPFVAGALVRDETRAPYAGAIGNLVHEGRYRNRFTAAYARVDHPVADDWRMFGQASYGQWSVDDEVVVYPPGWRSYGNAVDIDGDGVVEVFPDGLIERERYSARDVSVESRAEWEPQAHARITAGVEARRTWVSDTSFETNSEARLVRVDFRDWNRRRFPEVDRLFIAPYVQVEHQPADWIQVAAGGRFDAYDDFGSAFSPRATVIVTPGARTTVRALYGRAFRAPTLRELHDPAVREQGNPDLRAEVLQAVQVKVSHRPTDDVELRAAGYALQIDDRIDVGETTSQLLPNPYFNLAGTRGAGGDLEVRVGWAGRYRVIASGAYHYTVDRASDTRVGRIAAIAVNALAEAQLGDHVVVSGALRYRGERTPPAVTTFQRSFLPNTAQSRTALVDVVIRSRALPDGWWLQLAGRNLAAASYREVPRDAIYLLDEVAGTNTLPSQPRTLLLELGKQF